MVLEKINIVLITMAQGAGRRRCERVSLFNSHPSQCSIHIRFSCDGGIKGSVTAEKSKK
jgi:hypothetical protein